MKYKYKINKIDYNGSKIFIFALDEEYITINRFMMSNVMHEDGALDVVHFDLTNIMM